MFSVNKSNTKQLVFCDADLNLGSPVFLKIQNNDPVALFGSEKKSVIESPESPITAVSLQDREKASGIACCDDSVVVLSASGRVFSSAISDDNASLDFACVEELKDHKIVGLSGTYDNCLVVSDNGSVFGRGSNEYDKLGIGKDNKNCSSFVKIPSLDKFKIRAAYAGADHSLFETQEGKILSCGCNYFSQLLLKEHSSEHVCSPTETTINFGASFSIAGDCISFVFIGGSPPPNTPNIRI